MLDSRLTRALCALAFLAGCDSATSVVTGDGAPSDVRDSAAVEVAVDTPAPMDVAPMDAPDVVAPDAADVPPADVPMRCATNANCAGNPAGSVCDTASGRCVQCVMSADTCPPNLHCAGNACVAGCRSDEGCGRAMSTGDSGPGVMLRCETTAHACVECARDEHCADGNLCVGNVCVAGCTATRACPTGQACCSGACTDPQTNLAHCGACDNRCAVPNAMPACMNGRCAVGVCTAPFADCNGTTGDGCETNTQTDTANCGRCGGACPSRVHAAVTCTTGRCGFTCETGFADCNADPADGCETDLNADPMRCGSCATVCDPPNGTAACAMGRCAVATCSAGFGNCDGNPTNGCETNTRTNSTHCGMCGTTCPERPNSFPGCVAGGCVISCVAGFADCDGDAANGCETDTRTSATNCGTCGRLCSAPGGAGVCAMSVCRVAGCDDGRGDCDGRFDNGCETDLRATVTHCGACGNTCPARANSTPVCAMGACAIACNAGFGNCDGMDANGCETDLSRDASHCGVCGTLCALDNATARCETSLCRVSTCTGTYGNCDMFDGNGCEIDTSVSVAHCGGCGRACSFANAVPTCGAGACAMGACLTGFSDCDRSAANGCETVGACRYASCGAVPRTAPDGVYTLTSGGADWSAYCDMTSEGGGWTLILKADGRQRTFLYSSALWTNTDTLNPTSTNMSETEAKFAGFSSLAFTAIRAGMRDAGALRFITVATTAGSFRELFTGAYRASTAGRAAWRSLLASPSLQPNCNREGFNVDGGSYQRVRFGIFANQENDCATPDSRIGFGGENNLCGVGAENSVGNVSTCSGDAGDRDTRVFGYVFVR